MTQSSPACPLSLPTFSTKYLPRIFVCVVHFLRYDYSQCLGTWQHGRAITNCSTALSSSQPLGARFVQSGEWRVFSGLSVFVHAETNIHIEIRVENFQLEQLLSDINQLNTLSLLFNLHSAPRILNSADFIPLWPCIVYHYR